MKHLIAGLALGLGLLHGALAEQQIQTQTYDFIVPADSTDYTGSKTWAAFDSSLGTLWGLSFSYNLSTDLGYSVTNNGTASTPISLSVVGGYIDAQIKSPVFPYTLWGVAEGFYGDTTFTLAPGQTNSGVLTATVSSGYGPKGLELDLPIETYTNGFTTYFEVVTPYLSVGARNPRNLSIDGTAHDVQGSVSMSYFYDAAPVPEPESYAMFLAGLGLIGAMVRRRKML